MSRERAIDMVARYDHVRPSDMDVFLNSVDMRRTSFLAMVEPMRDPSIWKKGGTLWGSYRQRRPTCERFRR